MILWWIRVLNEFEVQGNRYGVFVVQLDVILTLNVTKFGAGREIHQYRARAKTDEGWHSSGVLAVKRRIKSRGTLRKVLTRRAKGPPRYHLRCQSWRTNRNWSVLPLDLIIYY